MSDKLKRLAKNISELLSDVSTPQDTYYSLVHLMKKQRDYFQNMSPENILKLIFYCFSYSETKSFELSDKMLNNIGFAVLFYNTGNHHREECDECGGNGENPCDRCDGDGTIDCDECDTSGEMECPQCSGSGEIEDGGEMVTCDDCDGAGVVSCDECGGDGNKSCDYCSSGRQTCDYCDGLGEIETDDYDYERNFIVTWNKSIKDRCEYTEGDTDISFSEYDFDRLRDEYIKLKIDEKWVRFANWVGVNEIYCSYYNDNPKMYLTNDMELDTFKSDDMTPYTKK
jgi:hypothetical protein